MRKVPKEFTLIVICVPTFAATSLFLSYGLEGNRFPAVVTDKGSCANLIHNGQGEVKDIQGPSYNGDHLMEQVDSFIPELRGRGSLQAIARTHKLSSSSTNTMCQHLQHYYSLASLLRRLQEPLLNASFTHLTEQVYRGRALDVYTMDTIHQGLKRLMELFTPDRVRSSFMHPMPAETSRKLANILHKRLQDPQNNPPLHIMMFGGSIVAGIDAALYQQRNVTLNGNNMQARSTAQWQTMLDTVFPSGTVVVTNMGVGGMSSDVASVVLEYAIWPSGYPSQGPDIVVSAHGLNDLARANPDIQPIEGYKKILSVNHMFLKAAYGNRCDGLPAVILVDDSLTVYKGWRAARSLLHSRAVSELATWHNVMAVSYTRAFMKYTYSDTTLGAGTSRQEHPSAQVLFAWDRYHGEHPKLFFHTGLSWLLTFSFLQTMHDFCQDEADPQPTLNNKTNDSFHELNPMLMPELTDDKAPGDVAIEWENATTEWTKKCSCRDYTPGNTCSYYWVVHRATSVFRTKHVYKRIRSVASSVIGWEAQGHAVNPPRTGWVAKRSNASFEIKILARTFPIRKVSILYMKSYGEAWKDSRLQVDLTVIGKNGKTDHTRGELTGIHNSSTSVNYNDVFPVKAFVGETVVAHFHLVGGSTFKISGMFFCAT